MNDDELRQRLRAADPATDLPPAGPDRVERLLQVATAPDADRPSTRGRLVGWVLAAAAAVLVGGYLTLGLVTGDDDLVAGEGRSGETSPTAPPRDQTPAEPLTVLTAPGAVESTARCLVPTAEALRSSATRAFDATVTSLEGDRVTLAVSRWYVGDGTDTVEVVAPSEDLQALIGAVAFTDGARYLVAATGADTLMVCGFSAPYTADSARLYDEAFR